MIRLFGMTVLVLLASVVPSVVHAQWVVVPPGSQLYPIPPTGVPAWLQPAPLPPPVVQPVPPMPLMPTYTPPVYVNPVLVLPGRGIDPWIPLAGVRAPVAPSSDLLGQLLLLQQLSAARAARPQSSPAPTPAPVAPPPFTPAPTGDGWMSGFIKGVN